MANSTSGDRRDEARRAISTEEQRQHRKPQLTQSTCMVLEGMCKMQKELPSVRHKMEICAGWALVIGRITFVKPTLEVSIPIPTKSKVHYVEGHRRHHGPLHPYQGSGCWQYA